MAAESTAVLLERIRRLANAKRSDRFSDRELLTKFVRKHDNEAFAALVERHGPLVWRICRRTLPREQDAEDAFQAVFLVLLRKAATERWQESLAGWLYAVAVRIALKLRRQSVGRIATPSHQKRATADALDELTAREALAVIDEELVRLPEKYRSPVVLCLVEGRTQEETARQTGWSLSTVRRRLERGRALLQTRLSRRGLGLSVGLGVLLSAPAGNAAVPVFLEKTLLEAARLIMAGEAATSAVSTTVAALAEGIGPAGSVPVAAKAVAGMTIMLGILAVGAGLTAQPAAPAPPAAEKPRLLLQAASKIEEPVRPRTDLQGDPLPEEALARLGTVRLRHNWAQHLVFAQNGQTLYSQGENEIGVWDLGTGKERQRFSQRGDRAPEFLAISPNGDRAVTRDLNDDGSYSLALWEVAGQRRIRVLGTCAEKGYYASAYFSPDGKLLASIVDQGGVRNSLSLELWEIDSGAHRHSWKPEQKKEWSRATFSADSTTLATGGSDGSIQLWDVASGKQMACFTSNVYKVWRLAFSPDGTLLAAVDYIPGKIMQRTSVRIVDVTTGQEVRRLSEPTNDGASDFHDLAFSPDGKTLITSSSEPFLRVWDSWTGREIHRFPLGVRSTSGFVFSPDRTRLALTDYRSITLLDPTTGRSLLPFAGHKDGIRAIALTSDNRTIVTVGGDSLWVWDRINGKGREINELSDGRASFVTTILHPNGRTLFVLTWNRSVVVWDLLENRAMNRWPAYIGKDGDYYPGCWKSPLALSCDAKTLALRGEGECVLLVDATTGRERQRLPAHNAVIHGLAFTADGGKLAVWCRDHTAHVWDLVAGQEVRQFPFLWKTSLEHNPDLPWRAVLSPDGAHLAYGAVNDLVIYDLAKGAEVRCLRKLPYQVSEQLAYSSDGKMLAVGAMRDSDVRLIEVHTMQERQRLRGHKDRISTIAISADNRTLVTGSEDTTALVWDLTGRIAGGSKWDVPLSAGELEGLWSDLAASDAARAWKATQRLAAAPAQSVPFVAKRVSPVPKVDEARVNRLIGDLGSDQFAVRDQAMTELEKLGEMATAACRKALEEKPALEVRRRLEALLAKEVESRRAPSGDRLRGLRAVELLEWVATPDARQTLVALAQGAPGAALTEDAKASLARLNRSMADEKPR